MALFLFAFSSCDSDSLDIPKQNAIETINLDAFQFQSNMPRDGRNPQTGLCAQCFRIPCRCSYDDD